MAGTQMDVLVVEDEPAQREVLAYNLEAEGYTVRRAQNGEEAMMLIDEAAPDLIILDWMMPLLSGIEVCRQVKTRPETRGIPVIMLSARSEEVDAVRGLDTGADDYVIKPFDLDEVKARIHTVCRRSADQFSQTAVVRDLSISFSDHSVSRAGEFIRLTAKEWSVLEVLLRRKSKIVPKESLEAAVYAYGDEVESNALEAHISRLRAKLGKDLIVTYRGIGYMLNP